MVDRVLGRVTVDPEGYQPGYLRIRLPQEGGIWTDVLAGMAEAISKVHS